MKTSMKWKGGEKQPAEEITPTHAFCVPLETCVPSSNNEVRLHMHSYLCSFAHSHLEFCHHVRDLIAIKS